jgi:hypothetical protein
MGNFLPNETHETSGQWWFPIPNQADGTPPPAGSPNRAVNIGNGADFLLGTYDPTTETFKPYIAPGNTETEIAHLEKGSASWWGASGGSDNNGRAMMIGWATPDYVGAGAGDGFSFLTRLTLLRELHWDVETSTLVSNPVPELLALRSGVLASERAISLSEVPHIVPGTSGEAAASADVNVTFFNVSSNATSFGVCVLTNGQLGNGIGIYFGNIDEHYLPNTDIPGGDYNVTNVSYDDPHICQAQCSSDGEKCLAWTYVVRPPLVGSCCLKNVVDQQKESATCTSGIKNSNPVPPGSVQVRVGACNETSLLSFSDNVSTVRINADGTVNVRILPDRSVADFFVNAGRWAGTQSWVEKMARNATDSTILLWGASGSGIQANVDVYSMDCGWVDPSYTDSPTL